MAGIKETRSIRGISRCIIRSDRAAAALGKHYAESDRESQKYNYGSWMVITIASAADWQLHGKYERRNV